MFYPPLSEQIPMYWCGMLCCSAHSRIACEKPIEGTRYRTLPPMSIRSVKVLPVIISLRPESDNLHASLWCVLMLKFLVDSRGVLNASKGRRHRWHGVCFVSSHSNPGRLLPSQLVRDAGLHQNPAVPRNPRTYKKDINTLQLYSYLTFCDVAGFY